MAAIARGLMMARNRILRPLRLRRVDKALSIGISAGPAKHAVMYAALRSGYINAAVTDEATAEYVLEHSHVH
ncbi:MAG: sugar-binding domain-containing protein [Parvibaculaceae bacterium]